MLFYIQVLMFTQRVMSEYTIWFFVFLIVTATWAIMSLMIAAMLARFKAVSLAEGLRLMQERAKVGRTARDTTRSAPMVLLSAPDPTTRINTAATPCSKT